MNSQGLALIATRPNKKCLKNLTSRLVMIGFFQRSSEAEFRTILKEMYGSSYLFDRHSELSQSVCYNSASMDPGRTLENLLSELP